MKLFFGSHAHPHAHPHPPSNFKNRLQEFCQQNGLSLPIYDSYRKSDGTYISKCTILYNQNTTIICHGDASKVKDAEKKAAENVLHEIHLHNLSRIQLISRKDNQGYTVIYIDMENINVNELIDLFKFQRYNPTQYVFKGFLSVGHHYSETEFNFEGVSFEKILVPNTRSDAADIGMIMHAMTVLSSHHEPGNIPTELVFVSRDRFSCVFVELSQKGFCVDNNRTKIVHCPNVAQLKTSLAGNLDNTIFNE